MSKNSCLVATVLSMIAACSTPPPKPWLRYELDGMTEWMPSGAGIYAGQLFGASVRIDLRDPKTPMMVLIDNPGQQPVEVRVGPDAGSPRGAIGEVLLRRIDQQGAGGPDMQGYNSMQSLRVDGGWRATLFLDSPLGREMKLGQRFALSIEAQNEAGERMRRSLPVVAKMGGTVPVSPR